VSRSVLFLFDAPRELSKRSSDQPQEEVNLLEPALLELRLARSARTINEDVVVDADGLKISPLGLKVGPRNASQSFVRVAPDSYGPPMTAYGRASPFFSS